MINMGAMCMIGRLLWQSLDDSTEQRSNRIILRRKTCKYAMSLTQLREKKLKYAKDSIYQAISWTHI